MALITFEYAFQGISESSFASVEDLIFNVFKLDCFQHANVLSPSDSVTYVHHCTPIYCRANIFKKENGSLWIGIVSFEPEYSEEELRHREEEFVQRISPRLLVMLGRIPLLIRIPVPSHCEEWCLCTLFAIGKRQGRVCCYGLFAEKALLNAGECLTNRPEFSQIFLQPVHLELCFVNFLRYKNPFPTAAENITNRYCTPQ
ncbi:hypothetical protein BSL78_27720 [Apostichopus japonicus]|uniref:Uncharacterized protein n=1 Tax=Stichopus japonicus TaxID=307972 RepID=A0A2G8JI74_STIJA|nr:hypothetical protein BSL78_27720 [Apostichopus japonicus]